jgi:hypothetical protein
MAVDRPADEDPACREATVQAQVNAGSRMSMLNLPISGKWAIFSPERS